VARSADRQACRPHRRRPTRRYATTDPAADAARAAAAILAPHLPAEVEAVLAARDARISSSPRSHWPA
jgi:hypothetical protein